MVKKPKIQKTLYPHIPKIDPSIPYPFIYLQKYPVSVYVFGQYPCIPKNPSRASLLGTSYVLILDPHKSRTFPCPILNYYIIPNKMEKKNRALFRISAYGT